MNKYIGLDNLKKYSNKKIRVTTKNQSVFTGVYSIYTPAGDNEPEIESISLETPERYYDIDTPDIIKIEILD
ncbi:hypothetical protein [Anaerococcus sp. Marseille-P3625]|uniref:hypothetical protein n=1 Tax=Anaerococcus sp. Marseille-P3625 TaxID=1977277 RepID=UPI000C078A16|nr:hypothetical protein [Anaerococcus sp. Marseille-P3625]